MPEMEISEAQLATLEELRDDLAEEHAGEYAHVRLRDALQFLLDRHEADDADLVAGLVADRLADHPYQELQRLAGRTDGVDPSGTADELRERLATARAEAALSPDDWELRRPTDGATDDEGTGGEAAGGGDEDGTPDDEAAADDGSPSEDETAPGDGGAETAAGAPADDDGADGGDGPSRLQQMMELLDAHDDKWAEADAEEGRYEVTLPDGETELVRTRDDVRALLFEHYV